MKVQVLNLDGSNATGDIELSDDVFGLAPRADILHRVVTWQLESRRGIARGQDTETLVLLCVSTAIAFGDVFVCVVRRCAHAELLGYLCVVR